MTAQMHAAAVTCVQPIAIVDHIARLTEEELKAVVEDELGGSRRVERETITQMLEAAGASKFETRPGGSSANTIKALSGGFQVKCRLLGARGDDTWGEKFEESMIAAGVDVSRLQAYSTPTGRSLILSCGGDRTMRTCLDGCTRLQAPDVTAQDLASDFVVLSGYCMYGGSFTAEVVSRASQAGASVMLDLASWEIVERFHEALWAIVTLGCVHTLSGNEDEWLALAKHVKISRLSQASALDQSTCAKADNTDESPCLQNGVSNGTCQELKTAQELEIITAMQREAVKHCQIAVTTRSSQGCVAMDRFEQCIEPAEHMSDVVDTTGAGDLFSAGFLYGQLCKCDLRACCRIGCIVGAAVTQVEGAILSDEMWKWAHAHIQEDPRIELPAVQ